MQQPQVQQPNNQVFDMPTKLLDNLFSNFKVNVNSVQKDGNDLLLDMNLDEKLLDENVWVSDFGDV